MTTRKKPQGPTMHTLDSFTTALISKTPVTLTNIQSSLKSFLTSKRNVNLKQCDSNEQIIEVFSSACGEDLRRIVRDDLSTPSLDLLKKSEDTSNALRAKGNDHYKHKRVNEALRSYTLAAAFAPKGSKALALAYSNRSACYYESNNPTLSLNDIKMFESMYPHTDNISAKLQERKQKCTQKQTEPQTPSDEFVFCTKFFTLKSPNEKIPSAESFIGIRTNNMRGRHVVNGSDSTILPGQLIILEPPYAKILLREYSFEYAHCTTCLKDLNGGGIPCDDCVFALYCSPHCKANSTHTPEECRISPYLHELKPDRTINLSLKILLSTDINSLNQPEPPSNHPPGFTKSGTYDSSTYPPIKNLIYHPTILSNEDVLKYSTTATILTELLTATNSISPNNSKPFSTHLLLHQQNLPCNAHSIYKLNIPKSPTPTDIRTSEYEEIGAGAYALLSLINHSCDPNVIRISLTSGTTAVISIRTIQPNEEILDNYGVHFATDQVTTRQSHLSTLYNFTCDCIACTQSYPTIEHLLKVHNAKPICSCDNAKCECDNGIWRKNLAAHVENYESAETLLLSNNPLSSLNNSISALTFFDSKLQKPTKLVCISQEYMKQALFLITRSLFR